MPTLQFNTNQLNSGNFLIARAFYIYIYRHCHMSSRAATLAGKNYLALPFKINHNNSERYGLCAGHSNNRDKDIARKGDPVHDLEIARRINNILSLSHTENDEDEINEIIYNKVLSKNRPTGEDRSPKYQKIFIL